MGTAINIKGTFDTPNIEFDPKAGKFSISGRSLPPNSFDFYAPIVENVKEYLLDPVEETLFNFKMEFISSSSTKIFQELFFELENSFKKGKSVKVNWYYKFGDDDLKELGDDLRIDTTFPFEYIAFE